MPKRKRKSKGKTKEIEEEEEEERKRDGESEAILCDVCTLSHSTQYCPIINTGVKVEDALLPKKAFLTLPSSLETEECNGRHNVVSKYGLAKGTQFGPLDAPKTSKFNTRCPYLLKIFKGNQILHFLDTTDQDKCNWMTLVRFNEDLKTRNCICYQLKQEIYFTLIEDVSPGQALVVGYSPGYSAQLEKNQQSKISTPNNITTKSKGSDVSNIKSKNSPKKSLRKFSAREKEVPIDIKLHNTIKAEPEIESNQEHYDHDYVAPIFGDQNFKQKEDGKESTVRKSSRKRKLSVDPDFDFGKRVRTDDKEDDEDYGFENISDNRPSTQERNTKKKGKRLYAVRAVEKWKCKFCHDALFSIESFALHLTEHYKKVGAAKTEKERIRKLDSDLNKQTVSNELNPKVVLVRLKERLSIKESEQEQEQEKHDEKEEVKEVEGAEDQKIEVEPTFPYECDICVKQKIFNRAEYLIRHLRNHSGEIFCYECNVKFSSKEEQLLHECSVSQGKDEEPKVCTLCDKSYSSLANLRQHLRVRHGMSFKCSTCRRLFLSEESLMNHICKPKKTKPDSDITIMHKCEICEQTFSKLITFEKHLKTHDRAAFTCPVCSKVLSNESLKIHIAVCEVLQKFLDRKTEDLTCPCHKCEKSFADLQDFKDHVASHTHPFMCPSCNIRLKTADEIRSHSCKKLLCDCDECDKMFGSLNDLKSHIADTHGGSKSYCFECAFPFVTTEGYVRHGDCELRRSSDSNDKLSGKFSKPCKQNGDGLFICEVCGVFYTKWSSMKTHRYTHGPKKFFCGKCEKSFHRKELLADHVYVHEEAQFTCVRCEKKFKSKKSLEVHIRIHDNIKPYKCHCGRSFTQKVNLRSHEMTHIPEDQKGFVCPVESCSKIFFSKEYLKFHVEAHEKGKRYTCDVCDKQFVRMHMLNQHKRTAHGDHKYQCEFCVPILHLRQKHSLFRHLKKRHPDFQEVWSQEGYGDKMYIPGDGSYNHQSIKTRPAKQFHKEQRNSSSDDEAEGDIQEHADMTVMISGSMEDGTEEIEIEAQEVDVDEEVKVGSAEISNQGTNMVLLQLDGSGRYVLAFPNQIQRSGRCDDEEEYVMEEIGTFE